VADAGRRANQGNLEGQNLIVISLKASLNEKEAPKRWGLFFLAR